MNMDRFSDLFDESNPRLNAVKASDIMCEFLMMVPADSLVKAVAAGLVEAGISGVPVIDDDNNIVGVISMTDIVRYSATDTVQVVAEMDYYRISDVDESMSEQGGYHLEKFDDTTVAEIMTPHVISVDGDASLLEVLRIMHEKKIRRVLVKAEGGDDMGLIASTDIMHVVEQFLRLEK